MTRRGIGGASRPEVERAIAAADLRVLVMCLFHITGDERWLHDPFRPVRDVRLIADPDAGFDADTRTEIRRAVVDWCCDSDGSIAVADPGADAFGEMLSIFLGEVVAPEYVPMVREDFGFDPRDTADALDVVADGDIDVLIVGAGASGICLAIKLDRLGIPFRIIDKNPELGGTWFENRYPGCGVDTPNHLYSFSFAPKSDWQKFLLPPGGTPRLPEDRRRGPRDRRPDRPLDCGDRRRVERRAADVGRDAGRRPPDVVRSRPGSSSLRPVTSTNR